MIDTDSFFDELMDISSSITKEAAGFDFRSNPVKTGKRGATVLGLGTAAYKGIKGYADDRKETARDIQQNLSPQDQKKAKKLRRVGAVANGALATGTAAALGYGAGKANEWARAKMAPENAGSVVGDYAKEVIKNVDTEGVAEAAGEKLRDALKKIKEKHVGSKAADEAAAVIGQVAKRGKRAAGRASGFSKIRIGLKKFIRDRSKNWSRNLRNAANHKFASVR